MSDFGLHSKRKPTNLNPFLPDFSMGVKSLRSKFFPLRVDPHHGREANQKVIKVTCLCKNGRKTEVSPFALQLNKWCITMFLMTKSGYVIRH